MPKNSDGTWHINSVDDYYQAIIERKDRKLKKIKKHYKIIISEQLRETIELGKALSIAELALSMSWQDADEFCAEHWEPNTFVLYGMDYDNLRYAIAEYIVEGDN